jgi:hypothetical protein
MNNDQTITTTTQQSEPTINEDFVNKCETWEDFVSLGLIAREYKDKSQWILGRCALSIETKYGDNTLNKYAKEIGLDVKTLQNYRWVVKIYLTEDSEFKPSPKLPFKLYETVATMKPDERKEFLEQADDNNFSIEKARIERKKKEGKPIHPAFKIIYCPLHKKWWFIPEDRSMWEKAHDTIDIQSV